MTNTDSNNYGLGLVAVNFSPTQSGYGHSGSILGFTSTMAIDPASGDTLVILANDDTLVPQRLAASILAAGS